MLLFYSTLLPLAYSYCFDSWPNGTAYAVNFWNCDSTSIQFTEVGTYLTDGHTHTYPVSLQSAVLLKTKIVNSGAALSGLQSSMSLSTLEGSDINNCYWSVLPTYGTLNDKAVCSDSIKCPIVPGSQTLDILLDFSKTAPATLQMLGADSDVQIQYRLWDPAQKDQACLMMQMRMTHK